jgi:DNA-binding MurR/RpiR family transcriptional regulator
MNPGSDSLPERVRLRYDVLSESQRTIARYCVSRPEDAGSLTAMRIAEKLGVSESTVVRFAVKIGYDGFPDMQAAIRAASRNASAPVGDRSRGNLEGRTLMSLRNDLDALQQSIEEIDLSALTAAATTLDVANTVFVCGFRTSFSLAFLADFHIRKVHKSVRLLGDAGGTLVDDMDLIGPGDAVLAFTFPVYDDRTIQVVHRALAVQAASVVVTDSALAPLPIDPKVHPLTVRHDSVSFFNSTVAAAALLNAIVVRMVEIRGERDAAFEHALARSFHSTRSRLL